ncbi:hypothetical protein QFZ24_005153 [Streptomyces phaeochromogenes]|jgi:hypothetical protein|nr:hypothetical protein [Streptomyces phaeochromogenes]
MGPRCRSSHDDVSGTGALIRPPCSPFLPDHRDPGRESGALPVSGNLYAFLMPEGGEAVEREHRVRCRHGVKNA